MKHLFLIFLVPYAGKKAYQFISWVARDRDLEERACQVWFWACCFWVNVVSDRCRFDCNWALSFIYFFFFLFLFSLTKRTRIHLYSTCLDQVLNNTKPQEESYIDHASPNKLDGAMYIPQDMCRKELSFIQHDVYVLNHIIIATMIITIRLFFFKNNQAPQWYMLFSTFNSVYRYNHT